MFIIDWDPKYHTRIYMYNEYPNKDNKVTHLIFEHIHPCYEIKIELNKAWEFYEQAQRERKAYKIKKAIEDNNENKWFWICDSDIRVAWDPELHVWRIVYLAFMRNPNIINYHVETRLINGNWIPCLIKDQ